jgi:DNA-binding CsgD family transcriptional regulator
MHEPRPRNSLQSLRQQLLDSQRESAPSSMLDCGAHMLLYLDEPSTVLKIGLHHLLERFDATRIDLGFASPCDPFYRASTVERRPDCSAPNVLGVKIPNRHCAVQTIWHSNNPICFDIRNEPGLHSLRPMLDHLSTRAKMARRLEWRGSGFGIICVDQTEERRSWHGAELVYFDQFVLRFLSPIIVESRLWQACAPEVVLSEAERRVVRLAAQGLAYKEIAAALHKSPNTVDNQLRHVRTKLGVRNQVELVRACADFI